MPNFTDFISPDRSIVESALEKLNTFFQKLKASLDNPQFQVEMGEERIPVGDSSILADINKAQRLFNDYIKQHKVKHAVSESPYVYGMMSYQAV